MHNKQSLFGQYINIYLFQFVFYFCIYFKCKNTLFDL